jgi:hypothetical protein
VKMKTEATSEEGVGGLRRSLLDSGLIRRVLERIFGVGKSKIENELLRHQRRLWNALQM